MKKHHLYTRFLFLLAAVFFIISLSFSQSEYEKTILKEREEFRIELLESNSVLNEEEKANILDLTYFPIDSSWTLTARFKKNKGKVFEMPTTTERLPKYRRIGYLYFERNGEKFRLTAYKNLDLKEEEYKNYVFIPFRDWNAPEITYGGGRYLDIHFSEKQKTVIVDFNKAYNPYCVYSHRYSCPITPPENHIEIKINAGVQNPKMLKE